MSGSARSSGDLPVNSFIQPAGLPTTHLPIEVLRRPIESAQYTSGEFANRLGDWHLRASYGSTGDCFDCEDPRAGSHSDLGGFRSSLSRVA